jgi:hypothetical protein
VFAIEGPGTISGETLFRADDHGRVYILTGAGEQLFLDTTNTPDKSAVLQITGPPGSFRTDLGTFGDSLSYRNLINSLLVENGTLVRGVGVVASEQDMLTGSSGGFFEARTLIEASLAGGLHFSLNASSLQLGIESLNLNVSGRQVTNCAIPCYFAACGLVPGTDPPDTYKPCARARIELRNWPAGANRAVRLQLFASNGLRSDDSVRHRARRECIFCAAATVLGTQPAVTGGQLRLGRQRPGQHREIHA